MNINTKLPVAVHILALLALEEKRTVTSELLAKSVDTNPVVIRKLMAQLKKAQLVQVRPGVGGAFLCRSADKITLLDAYLAVRGEGEELFHLHQHPSQQCYVGRNIQGALCAPFAAAQKAMEDSLAKTSIADIAAYISAHSPRKKRPSAS